MIGDGECEAEEIVETSRLPGTTYSLEVTPFKTSRSFKTVKLLSSCNVSQHGGSASNFVTPNDDCIDSFMSPHSKHLTKCYEFNFLCLCSEVWII